MTMFRKMMGAGATGIPQDFIAAYNFSGNTLDRSANALNGTLIGGATITNDRLNVAAIGQYMQVNDSDLLSFGSGAFSFSFNFFATSINTSNPFICKRDDASSFNNSRAEWLCSLVGGKLRLAIYDSSQSVASYFIADSNMIFSANTLYKVQVVFAGGAGNFFKFYVNGVLVTHTIITSGTYVQMRNTTARLIFGVVGWDYGNQLSGYLDNLYIYNRELTTTEIAQLAAE